VQFREQDAAVLPAFAPLTRAWYGPRRLPDRSPSPR
jgi:hypothetical protein